MEACPALAYERDPATGAVLIRQELCIGCRYCSWACPYSAPRFEPDNGVMGKCTFCSHRLAEGLKPACAALCPTGALDYAELPEELLSAEIEGMPRTELGPSIRILPPKQRSMLTSSAPSAGVAVTESVRQEPRIELQSEWSLGAFTFLLTVLFALLAADAAGTWNIPPLLFAGIAAGAAALSLTHLGKPARSWRALLGLRRSPVSREVAGFGALAALGTLALVWPTPDTARLQGWLALAAGAFTLASADLVYRPVHQEGSPLLHSGGVLCTGLYFAGLAGGIAWLAGAMMLFKLVRFLGRAELRTLRLAAGVGRIGLGLLAPAIAWAGQGFPLPLWALAAAFLGEAIDRAWFYTDLEITSPERQMRADLQARLAASPPAQSPAGPAIRSTASASSS
jgi:ferredoxin